MNKLDQLADDLFSKFQQQFPFNERASDGRSTKVLSTKNLDRNRELFYEDARKFRRANRLWVLNWARVILKLQQRLLIADYPPKVVKPLLLGMIISSAKAK